MEKLRQKGIHILRWSEQFTKTDMFYLAKGGFFLSLEQIVSSALAFFMSIAFANLLPKETYGEYRYILSVIGVVGAFALTGLDTALSQAVARGLDGTLPKSFRMMLRYTLITSAITLGIAIYYFSTGNAHLAWGLVIAAICMPLLKSGNIFNGFLVGKKDFYNKFRYGLIYDILPAISIITSLFFTKSALVVILVYFISYTATSAWCYYITLKRHVAPNAPSEDIKTFSLHLSVMNILGSVSFQLDKVLTFHYLGAANLAVYSFALAMPQQIRQLQKIISTLVFPKFSARTHEEIRKTIAHKAFLLFVCMAALAGLYILVAPLLFHLLFPRYLDAIVYSQFFSLILLTTPGTFYKQALTAHKHTKELYIIQTVLPAVKIFLLFIFISKFGIVGAITTLLLTEVAGLITSIVLFYRLD